MPSDSELIAPLRAVADAAGVDVTDDHLRAVAPVVVALLRRSLTPPRSLGETEPAFGLQLRPE